MLQYCQAFFICLAQESNPGKLRVASRAVPPQRNYAAALWDPKPATSQQQSHTPPTRFLLLLYHLLRLCHFDKWVVIRRVEQAAPLKLRQSGPTQKKIIKKYVQAAKYTWKYYANKCGTTEQLPTVLPHPRYFFSPSLPLPAATHYDLRCGKNEGKVHSVCQRGRHRLRLPLALNFPLFLFFFCRTKNCWVLNIYWVEEYCGINRGWLCCAPKMLLVFHYVFQRFAGPAKFLGLNWGIICVIDWTALT